MHRLPNVDGILTQFEKLIRNCEGLVGFPLEPVVQILTEVGSLLEGRPAYDKLFETIVKINRRRSGEVAAAQLLLKRAAQQLDAEKPYEAIRTIGQRSARSTKTRAGATSSRPCTFVAAPTNRSGSCGLPAEPCSWLPRSPPATSMLRPKSRRSRPFASRR